MNASRNDGVRRSWRSVGLGLGAVILLWLPFEESGILPVVLLSAGLCTWAAAGLLTHDGLSQTRIVLRFLGIGVLAGLLVTPVAFLLMSLKSGLHAHPQPEYLPAQIQALFSRTIYYVISGALLGLGAVLLRLSRAGH